MDFCNAGRSEEETRRGAAGGHRGQIPAEARREPAEARREPAETRPAATEGLALKEGSKQLQRESAELKGLKESAELKGLNESAELKGLKESAELKRSKEKAASAEAVMDKPARPPDRLNEQFTVTSAVLVQEPGEPAELKGPGEPAELEEPGEPAELGEPEVPGRPEGRGSRGNRQN